MRDLDKLLTEIECAIKDNEKRDNTFTVSVLEQARDQLKVRQESQEQTDMDKLTTEMMEHICDSLCKHPGNAKNQEELDNTCAECKMGKFVCDILNTYNHLNSCGGCQNEECTKQLLPCRTCRRDKEDRYVRKES